MNYRCKAQRAAKGAHSIERITKPNALVTCKSGWIVDKESVEEADKGMSFDLRNDYKRIRFYSSRIRQKKKIDSEQNTGKALTFDHQRQATS